MNNKKIDNGNSFDWGKTSADYGKYRDIYPDVFYEKLIDIGLCVKGQNVLDLGTGTGVIPRNMFKFGAKFVGTDISKAQILEAKKLSKGLDINYIVESAENCNFNDNTFDVITAAQCYFYFDFDIVAKKLFDMLKPNGRFVAIYMGWLPFEDKIAGKSEELVLKYNSSWTGAGDTKKEIELPKSVYKYFDEEKSFLYDVDIEFSKDTWNGRMKACRGIGASLTADKIKCWEDEHKRMLDELAEDTFKVKHYVAMKVLRSKKR